jgi:glycosidase
MQWDSSLNAGFSSTAQKCWLPLNPNYLRVNAASEQKDSDSIYHFYQELMKARLQNSALNLGEFIPLKGNSHVFAYRRKDQSQSLLVLLNFSKKAHRIPRRLRIKEGTLLLSNYADTSLTKLVKLRPFEALLILEK